MNVIQILLAIVVGGVILTIGATLIVGLLAGIAGIVLSGLCIALVIYLIKANWKPTSTGYYAFIRQVGAFVGKPGIAMDVWRLQQGNTCAINAQRMVLAICGIHKTEQELAQRQQAYGLHSEHGSTDIANLMSGYGLAVKRVSVESKESFVKQLFYTLREGRLAVATVNMALLNTPDPSFRTQRRAVPDHVILLTGLRNIGSGNYLVYYTDSGTADGVLKHVDFRVMQEAAGPKLVATPVLFDGDIRRWPFSPTSLDPIPVNAVPDGPTIAPCPQCDQPLRFRLTNEARVSCPRCKYRFNAIKDRSGGRNTTRASSDWEQAGRDWPARSSRKSAGSTRQKNSVHENKSNGKKGVTFVEVHATCRTCRHVFAESVAAGPATVPLKCPECGVWCEHSTR